MAPGLILDRIIGIFKGYTNVAAIAMIGAGLFCFGIFRDRGMLVVGALLAGFGYGLMQPLIYDKTGHHRSATRGDAGTVVRHGGQLPGHHALSLPHRHLHPSHRTARRPRAPSCSTAC